ncbi:MAG: hypothetical protein KC800_04825 [Candidatus Eremiobacteraeota bacterium]|nr:hypothetical protein [Candidatus Eremiobacteraeota bacterium]
MVAKKFSRESSGLENSTGIESCSLGIAGGEGDAETSGVGLAVATGVAEAAGVADTAATGVSETSGVASGAGEVWGVGVVSGGWAHNRLVRLRNNIQGSIRRMQPPFRTEAAIPWFALPRGAEI